MIGVVHLLWAPLGPGPLREFLRSYHSHAAGAEHELVIVFNAPPQERDDDTRQTLLAELQSTTHRLIELEQPMLDLAAYGEVARRLEHERVCFLNSYSLIQADGWLGLLSRALDDPGVGLAGATGSWESQGEWGRGRAIFWPQQLITLRGARRDYPRFPNPHIRTTAFMSPRAAVVELGLESARDKRSAYLLESGHMSITREIQGRGLRAVVVGRDGRAYEVDDWPHSRTYRSGEQDNLLVADNRTRDWQRAAPRLRRRLTRDAWGEVL
jgi:hypothetical protein